MKIFHECLVSEPHRKSFGEAKLWAGDPSFIGEVLRDVVAADGEDGEAKQK